MSEYGLVFPFIDPSRSYTHGFEAGMLYQRMQSEDAIEMTVHTENLVQIAMMAERLGFCREFRQTGTEGWVVVRLNKMIKRVK